MSAFLSIIIILAAILLTLVIFIQNPKGGGLSSDFGSPAQLGGVKKTNEFIDKLTWSLAGTIVAASIVITMLQPSIKPAVPKGQNQKQEEKKGADAPAPKPNDKKPN
jgi:preprotein translocase subunit SecG